MVWLLLDTTVLLLPSCKDDSVLSQPFSHGMVISGEEEIYTPNEGIELGAYRKCNPWRDVTKMPMALMHLSHNS